jgi:hypothetical protein
MKKENYKYIYIGLGSIVVLFVAYKLIKGAKPKVDVVETATVKSEEDNSYSQSIPDITKNPLTGKKYSFL